MKNMTGFVEITVIADMRFANQCRSLACEMADRARLSKNRIENLLQVVDEAYENVVKHSYESEYAGHITMKVIINQSKFTVSFCDQGIPFDESMESVGSGLKLIRGLMDEVEWINLGPRGKELRMSMNLESDVGEYSELPTAIAQAKEPASPNQLYEIARFRPEHALGVARCFFDVYGYTYPTEYVYHPKRLIELNKSKSIISIVAVSQQTGQVVGHCAALRCYPGGAAEVSQAVVKRSHEGHFLLSKMVKLMDEEVIREEGRCLVSHEVTSHRSSQVIARRDGYKNCCLALGAMPDTLDFKKATGLVAQRESCVVSMKFLKSPEAIIICTPPHHQDMIEQIYSHLGREVSFEHFPLQGGAGSVDVRLNRAWNIGDIQVERIGTDTAVEVRRCLRDLQNIGGVSSVFLELPLDQGGVDLACREAEDIGFFFAGLGPNTIHGGESLFLQNVDPELDMSLLQIASPMGKKIFEYVVNERERVTRIEAECSR